MTDDRGSFAIRSLPISGFTITVSKAGFVTSRYGSAGPGRPSVAVNAAVEPQALSIKLQLASVISGTVRDAQGASLPGARVLAMPYPIGRPPLQETTTNDSGEYRLSGLAEGRYAILAEPGSLGAPPVFKGNQSVPLVLAPGFYGTGLSATDALPVEIGPEGNRHGIDIVLRYQPTYLVRGALLEADGRPTTGTIRMVSATPVSSLANATAVMAVRPSQPDGSFVFEHVVAGDYFIVANRQADAFLTQPMWGTMAVRVDRDIRVSVELRPAVTVSGSLKAAAAERLDGTTVELVQLDLRPGLPSVRARGVVSADGKFSLAGVLPGLYRFQFVTRPGLSVTGVVANGRRQVGQSLAVEQSATALTVHVETVSTTAFLTGSLLDTNGTPRPDLFVLLFSSDERFWLSGSDRMHIVQPGPLGEFEFPALAPGDYFVLALTETPSEVTSEFLRTIVGVATKVSLRANTKTNHVLQVGR